jgi:hypothetical protein
MHAYAQMAGKCAQVPSESERLQQEVAGLRAELIDKNALLNEYATKVCGTFGFVSHV